jgi:dTDP-glucose 4,6-dehydratase
MKKILVTGGCGFIGSNFINYIKDKYIIYNLDCLNYASNTTINDIMCENDNYHFVYGNLCNQVLVTDTLNKGIDIVVHFAAQSHVDSSFTNSSDFVTDNVMATNVLLEACKNYAKLELFVYISTDEVYGDSDTPKVESDALRPTNPYSATKAAAEMICSSYKYSFKMPIIITRSNNVYGELQFREKLIPRFIGLLKSGKKCTIHGTGECVRTFVHANDLSRAIELIVTDGTVGEIYNIGSYNEYSVLDIAKLLVKYIKGDSVNFLDWVEFVGDRYYNDTRYNIDFSKVMSLGWKNEIDFLEGLKELC